jgi:diguanylate cyclase (GGDEF)-like protein
MNAEQLSAELLDLEDQIQWDAVECLDRAVRLEHEAVRIGDESLINRARLSQANMQMRAGDIAGSARGAWRVLQWATDNGHNVLAARTHLVLANIQRHLGDHGQNLEHSVLAVELLDDTATAHMRVWHRAKLADAISMTGQMPAARVRYRQAVDLAIELDMQHLLMGMLNNWAYTEYYHGDNARAQKVAQQLQDHAETYGLHLDCNVLDTIGAIDNANGRYAEAERMMLTCIDSYGDGRADDADALAEFHLTLARARRGLGAYDLAQESLDTSRELCVERNLGDVLVRLHQEQAELHAARGDFAKAFTVHKMFFEAHNNMHSLQREAQARTRQAMFETTEARQEAERFREQARRDPLTGLRNRRYVDEQLPGIISSDTSLTLAIVDLDHFKRINDHLSHDVGDQVLVQVAKLLETELAAVCTEGFVARMGGEEFLIVLPRTPVATATACLDTIRRAVGGYGWGGLTQGLPVTVSIGVAWHGDISSPTQAALLSIADRNLYVAKHGGRDRVISGSPCEDRARSYRGASAA